LSSTEVAVIGVGPNGLSVAAHLRQAGVEHRAFGHPMGAWRFNMPAGMRLKSEPYASDLSAPRPGFLARDYCSQAREVYHERVIPLTREQFIDYGTWFADELVPDIDETEVVSLSREPASGFLIRTANDELIKADKVVVATGIIPFAYLPSELSELPSDLVSHSSEHSNLERFRGKEVLVVGSGSSALETAALLLEQGTSVKLLARDDSVSWPAPNPASLTRLQQLRRPVVRLCEGWTCWAYDRLPDVFRHLPKEMRVEKSLGFLGPAGAWWLRERVEGKVPTFLGRHVLDSAAVGDRVQLHLNTPTGRATETADHVIAGTGFRFDLSRLAYLAPSLRTDIKVVAGAPVLNHHLESNVPGLFFTGALAAPSLGPLMRFVAGTHFTGPRVVRRIRGKRTVRSLPIPQEKATIGSSHTG
jgi:FAD-dependent urate hydroxylase